MKEFSVCYDRFCLGNYTLLCDGEDTVQPTAELGAFEMYVLGMWNDGLVVTMKTYDEAKGENQYILLVPDGSEQLMGFSSENGFVVRAYRAAGEGRFAYLLDFLCGLKYKGYQGYEEYDEEEKMIFGMVRVGEKSLTYGGKNLQEVKADFIQKIEQEMTSGLQ
ncbi:MAG: hypothetical protein ACLTSL_04835 [Odoribacter splanchnicus]